MAPVVLDPRAIDNEVLGLIENNSGKLGISEIVDLVRDFDDEEVRVAIWRLLADRMIIMTPDRKVKR